MAKNMNILLTFEDAQFEKSIKGLLATKGVNATIHAVFSKDSVARYIRENPNTDAVVLMEVFAKRKERGKAEKYTAEEVAYLTGASDVNVIIILGENHKGTSYMGTLYSAGVTSAIFQKKDGVRPAEIAALILQKRTRNAAREYYGIGSQIIDVGAIESADYNRLYAKYRGKDGDNLVENYIKVCSELSMQQVADFTKRLPDDDKEYLAQFEEFHVVLGFLKKLGIDLKIKRPKTVSIGLKYVYSIEMNDGGSGMSFEKTGEMPSEEVPVKDKPDEPKRGFSRLFGGKKKKEPVKENVQEEKVNESDKEPRAVADTPQKEEIKKPVVEPEDSEVKQVTISKPGEEHGVAEKKAAAAVEDKAGDIGVVPEAKKEGSDRVAAIEEKADVEKSESGKMPVDVMQPEMSFADFLNGFGDADEDEDDEEEEEFPCVVKEKSLAEKEIVESEPALRKTAVESGGSVDEKAEPVKAQPEGEVVKDKEEDAAPVEFDESEYDDYVLLGESKGSGKTITIILTLIVLVGAGVLGYVYGFGNLF